MFGHIDPLFLLGEGWKRFQLNPLLFMGMWFVYALFQPSGGSGSNLNNSDLKQFVDSEILMLLGVIVVGWTLLCLVVGPILRGGYDLAMLRSYRGDVSVTFGDLFAGVPKALPLFLTGLLFSLAVVVGLVFCIVPGIILGLGLWPAFLLVMEDDLDPIAALKAAWALTKGYKLQLLILSVACGVVTMLGLLACCVGVFVAGPVAQLAWVGSYDIMREAGAHEDKLVAEAIVPFGSSNGDRPVSDS
jgi:uncharacterized membrane protein